MGGVIQFPQQVPFVDSRNRVDYRWIRCLEAMLQNLPDIGTGNVFNGSEGTYGQMTLFQGPDSAKAGAPSTGDLYFALDTGKIYFAIGTSWHLLSEALTGDVTKAVGSTVTSLASVFFTPGTYGSATQVPVLTIDSKGRVTNLWLEDVAAPPVGAAGPNGSLQFNNAGSLDGSTLIFYNPGTGGLVFSNPGPTREALSPLTTKGDIFVRNATASTRLPVGTDGLVLAADSSTATGLSYQKRLTPRQVAAFTTMRV